MSIGIPPLERQALLALYRQTAGENWPNQEGWQSSGDPTHTPWHGVTCENGHVTRLALRANGLQGPLPPQLGHLSQLIELDLAENQLQGPIPPPLGHLRKLEHLDLSGNTLHGPLPPRLRLLIRLQTLDLHNNRFTGPLPPFLGELTHLTRLNLADNRFQGSVPPEWGRLVVLENLDLSNNPLDGPLPATLIQLNHLTVFRFGETELRELGDAAFQTWLQGLTYVERSGHMVRWNHPIPPWWVTAAELGVGGSVFALIWTLSFPFIGIAPGIVAALAGTTGFELAARQLRPALPVPTSTRALPAPHWTAGQLAERLHVQIEALHNRAPAEVLEKAEALEQVLLEVLSRIPDLNRGDRDIYLVRQTVLEYLPEALAAYRALPPVEAATRPLRHGRTAQQYLLEQLDIMERGIRHIGERLSDDPIQRLLAHGRFLRDRFDTPDPEP